MVTYIPNVLTGLRLGIYKDSSQKNHWEPLQSWAVTASLLTAVLVPCAATWGVKMCFVSGLSSFIRSDSKPPRVPSCMIFSLLWPFSFFTICHMYHFTGTVISLLQATLIFCSTHWTPHSLHVLSKQERVGYGQTLSSDSSSRPSTGAVRCWLMASSFRSTLTQTSHKHIRKAWCLDVLMCFGRCL